MIDYKSLKGDTSDNIPGVPKVGEKTAIELLKAFRTLDNIYQNLDQIKKPALKENLKNNLPLAELSKRWPRSSPTCRSRSILNRPAAKIDWAGQSDPDLPRIRVRQPGEKIFQRSRTAYQTDNDRRKKTGRNFKFDFKAVKTKEALSALIKKLKEAEAFAFDLETTSLNPFEAEIVGISFSTEAKTAYYLPLGHKTGEQLPRAAALDKLRPLFTGSNLKIGHNLKYDIEILNANGIEVKGPYFDTMVAAYLIDPIGGKYSLKTSPASFWERK